MESQIYFPGLEPPDAQELSYLQSIEQNMNDAVETQGGSASLLSYKSNKSGYSVVIFRLRLRGKQNSISVPTSFEDLIPASWPRKQLKSEDKYIRIEISPAALDSYTEFLSSLAGAAVNRYPKEWDCCSRYVECSNAKRCVHPDPVFALSCGYRKNLNSGQIFYGKNRNI